MTLAIFTTSFTTIKKAENVYDFLALLAKQSTGTLVSSSTVDAFLDQGLNIHQIPGVEVKKDMLVRSDADFILSLGGDGTFLRAAHWAGNSEIPVAGINMGHLGYLTTFRFEELASIPQLLSNGEFEVEARTMLDIYVSPDKIKGNDGPWFSALNEVAILKQDTASIISIPVNLDGKELGVYNSDGLIVSTPTGSTAYNLSVGGPVLQPTVGALVLSPIADHSLTMRPMVISDDSILEVTALGRTSSFRVSLDGNSFIVPAGEKVRIKKAPFRCNMICKKGELFASTLRSKLLWGAGCES